MQKRKQSLSSYSKMKKEKKNNYLKVWGNIMARHFAGLNEERLTPEEVSKFRRGIITKEEIENIKKRNKTWTYKLNK